MSADNNNTEATTARREIDPVFKEAVVYNFGQLNLPIQTEVEVSRLPRTMDVLVVLNNAAEIKVVRTETAFSYARLYNQIELKGESDPLTLWGYRLVLGRANLYLGDNKISAEEMTITIVSARRPVQVLEHCPNDVRWKEVDTGHYVNTDLLPVHLFVCDELAIEPKNYLLLLFAASEEKSRLFLEQIVGKDNWLYINYALRLRPKLTMEILEMAEKSDVYQRRIDELTEVMTPYLDKEKFLKQMTPEERIRGLRPEELLRGLQPEDILCLLDAETLEKLKQLINDQDRK